MHPNYASQTVPDLRFDEKTEEKRRALSRLSSSRCISPWWYIWRNKYIVITVATLLIHISSRYSSVTPSFPHWGRIGRLIGNVDKYSKLMPLEDIQDSPDFDTFAQSLETINRQHGAPYIVFFDRSNLEVTLNHVCNLKYIPGARPRLAAVAFDAFAENALNKAHPDIPTFTADFVHVKNQVPSDLENKKYVTYQLILMLRARVAAAIAYRGIDFWAMQQDTIWTDNFAALELERRYPDANLIFDTVGNDQFHIYNQMKGWICGSTFFVRGGPLTAEFFQKVAHLMTRRQSPDSSIMTYLCGAEHYKCVKMPRWIISSSNFFMGNRKPVPLLIQIDHDSPLSKMDLFRKWNFNFMKDDQTCNATAVVEIKKAVTVALPEVRQDETPDDSTIFQKISASLRELIGFDPYRTKNFLRVHETLV